MTIHADSKFLKPKELVISSSKHRTHKSTKPFSTTLTPLNRYSFFNQILLLGSKIAMTIAIQGASFRYFLRPIFKLGTIYITLRKRRTPLRKTSLRTVRTRLDESVYTASESPEIS